MASEDMIAFMDTMDIMWILWIVWMIVTIWYILPRFIYRVSIAELESGGLKTDKPEAPLDKITCGGMLGLIVFAGPFIRLMVFSNGVYFKPFIYPGFTIPWQQIDELKEHQIFWTKGMNIFHSSKYVNSPVFLTGRRASQFIETWFEKSKQESAPDKPPNDAKD